MNEPSVGVAVIAQGKDLHRLVAVTSMNPGLTLLAVWSPDPAENAAASARYLLSVYQSLEHMLDSVAANVVLVGGFGTVAPCLSALACGCTVASLLPFCSGRETADPSIWSAVSAHSEKWVAIGPAWPSHSAQGIPKRWELSEQVVWHEAQFQWAREQAQPYSVVDFLVCRLAISLVSLSQLWHDCVEIVPARVAYATSAEGASLAGVVGTTNGDCDFDFRLSTHRSRALSLRSVESEWSIVAENWTNGSSLPIADAIGHLTSVPTPGAVPRGGDVLRMVSEIWDCLAQRPS